MGKADPFCSLNYLLNIPPDPDGRISGAHLRLLREIRRRLLKYSPGDGP
jgi:hypothetical protein